MLEQLALHRPGIARRTQAAAAGGMRAVHHLAIDVELELVGGGIADAHRTGAAEAGQPVHFPFGKAALAAQVQIMYGLAGERRLPEWEGDWLPGFGGARRPGHT